MKSDIFLNELGDTLYILESEFSDRASSFSKNDFKCGVDIAWGVVNQASHSKTSVLEESFISQINESLCSAVGVEPTQFICGEYPDNWNNFVEEFDEDDETNISSSGYVYILSQIIWGKHFKEMSLSTGWLCMNAYLLKFDRSPIAPKESVNEFLIPSLSGAARKAWDAEQLRGIMYLYGSN